MLSFDNRRGFTMVELLVSIAIIGILTAVFISGISQQKNISIARRTAEQITADIQASQNRALSGQIVSGSRPAGFGARFQQNAPEYYVYADANATTTPCSQVGIYNAVATACSPADTTLTTRTFDATMRVTRISLTGTDGGGNQLTCNNQQYADANYSVPNASTKLTTSLFGCTIVNTQTVTVTVRNSRLNLCYAVTVTATSGTVSSRSLTTCP